MQQFSFGGDTGTSYEELQRRRQIAQQMMLAPQAPKTTGEGIYSAAQSIAGALMGRKARQQQDKMKSEFDEQFSGIFTGGGGSTGQTSGGFNPSAPVSLPGESDMIGSEAMAALGTSTFEPGNRESFVKAMMPHAQRVSQQTGLDPRLVIAQAAQETGWGKSAPNNNFFGIKSHGKGDGARLSTRENINGQDVTIQDSFRQYGDIGQSADDYARFLQENPRYRELLSSPDLDSQVAALGRSGYATDPNYAASVGSIARSIGATGGGQPQDTRTAQAGGAGPDMARIAQLSGIAGSPMASESQRAVANALLAQEMKKGDPSSQLDLEYKRAQLEALRNPQSDPTGTMREYDLARSQGYEGSFTDYQLDLKKAGASSQSVTVNGETGAKPLGTKGDILIPDATSSTGYRVGQAEGSPAAMEAEEAARATQRMEENRDTSTSVITTAAQRAREAAGQRQVGGLLGQVAANNPASQNAELYRQVEVLKSNAKVENLNAMREASKTGGALGSVTEKETQMLADKSGALDPRSPNFERDLDDYERTLLQVVHGFEAGNRIFEASRGQSSRTQTGQGTQGFEAFAADPSAQAAAAQYGVTLEDMWRIKNGGQ
jgi:hypothetical protein